jgi:hypothetical protein
MIWDLALSPFPPPALHLSRRGKGIAGRLRKRDNFLIGKVGGGEGGEPNYATVRKPGPL